MIGYRDNYNISIANVKVNQSSTKIFDTPYLNTKTKFDVINDTFSLENIYINSDTTKKTKDIFLNDNYCLEKSCYNICNDKIREEITDIRDIFINDKDGLENSRLNIYLNSKNNDNVEKEKVKKNRKQTTPSKPKKKKRKNIIFDDLPIEEKSNFVALDCEMVGVGPFGNKSALARVCLIDSDHSILLDTYVKIEEPITDYRTYVSGIQEDDISHGLSLSLVRNLVLGMIQDKILVGHGLKCDLKALDIIHPWYKIRDSTKFPAYTYTKGVEQKNPRARKLRDLAKEHLNITIQEGIHCPIEDATAALELYKLNHRKWENLVKYNVRKTNRLLNSAK